MSKPGQGPRLDKVIHERSRLMILTYLASADNLRAAFTELRDQLGFTAGNLSIQLKNLEDAGFVRIEKSFVDNKPFTDVALTKAGEDALQTYLNEMEQLIMALKNRS